MSRWTCSDDPIPQDHIRLSDAFDLYYRTTTPNWRALDEALCVDGAADGKEADSNARNREAANARDAARGAADARFRSALAAGELRPMIRDPAKGASFELSRNGWLRDAGGFCGGLDEDFIEPGDFFQPGPPAEIDGYLRPVFFEERDFNKWLVRIASGGTSHRRGPKRKYPREVVRKLVRDAMDHHGPFSPDDPEWTAQADLERHVQSELEKRGYAPAESTTRGLIMPPLAEWLAERGR